MEPTEKNSITGESTISIILLAAGSSSRMGQSKQLLVVENESLLLRSVKAALGSLVKNVIVVLGAEEQKHRSVIEHLPVKIVHNKNWHTGMGSSIKSGLNHLLTNYPETQAAIISVCDQPLLTSTHLSNLIVTYQKEEKDIIASDYSNSAGVPALFDKSLFSELSNIPDEQGAKKIIKNHPDSIALLNFPAGEIDLDTIEEYEKFKKNLPLLP